MEDLAQLIKGCVEGEPNAKSRLYRMFAPKMLGVCLRYSKDMAEAEDNLQDGFIRVFEKINSFRMEGSLEGWIRRIMVNIALEKYRKQNILQTVEDISDYEISDFSSDAISKITTNDLLILVQELPVRYRMVFNLYVFEGMNHSEIAEELKISDGTSKSNLARARGILKMKIQKNFGLTEDNYSA